MRFAEIDPLIKASIFSASKGQFRDYGQIVITPSAHGASSEEVVSVLSHYYPSLDIAIDCDGDVTAS